MRLAEAFLDGTMAIAPGQRPLARMQDLGEGSMSQEQTTGAEADDLAGDADEVQQAINRLMELGDIEPGGLADRAQDALARLVKRLHA